MDGVGIAGVPFPEGPTPLGGVKVAGLYAQAFVQPNESRGLDFSLTLPLVALRVT